VTFAKLECTSGSFISSAATLRIMGAMSVGPDYSALELPTVESSVLIESSCVEAVITTGASRFIAASSTLLDATVRAYGTRDIVTSVSSCRARNLSLKYVNVVDAHDTKNAQICVEDTILGTLSIEAKNSETVAIAGVAVSSDLDLTGSDGAAVFLMAGTSTGFSRIGKVRLDDSNVLYTVGRVDIDSVVDSRENGPTLGKLTKLGLAGIITATGGAPKPAVIVKIGGIMQDLLDTLGVSGVNGGTLAHGMATNLLALLAGSLQSSAAAATPEDILRAYEDEVAQAEELVKEVKHIFTSPLTTTTALESDLDGILGAQAPAAASDPVKNYLFDTRRDSSLTSLGMYEAAFALALNCVDVALAAIKKYVDGAVSGFFRGSSALLNIGKMSLIGRVGFPATALGLIESKVVIGSLTLASGVETYALDLSCSGVQIRCVTDQKGKCNTVRIVGGSIASFVHKGGADAVGILHLYSYSSSVTFAFEASSMNYLKLADIEDSTVDVAGRIVRSRSDTEPDVAKSIDNRTFLFVCAGSEISYMPKSASLTSGNEPFKNIVVKYPPPASYANITTITMPSGTTAQDALIRQILRPVCLYNRSSDFIQVRVVVQSSVDPALKTTQIFKIRPEVLKNASGLATSGGIPRLCLEAALSA
jgi:hypothetical protein